MYFFRHFFLAVLTLAIFVLTEIPVLLADSTSSNPNPAPIIENEIDLFGDEEEDTSEPVSTTVTPHEEEREVIDERPKRLALPIPKKKVETADDKYIKARMAFLFGQYERAFKIWEPLAEEGHAKSQATIAWMYHTGKGVKKDLSIAKSWYEKAADQDHAIALNNLGVFYEQGLGVHKSYEQAAHWYTESAEWGYGYAQYNLGILFKKGKGVKKDIDKAIYWLQLAALQGVQQAQQTLTDMSNHKGQSHPDTTLNKNAQSPDKEKPDWQRVQTGKLDSPIDHSPHVKNNIKPHQHKFHRKAESKTKQTLKVNQQTSNSSKSGQENNANSKVKTKSEKKAKRDEVKQNSNGQSNKNSTTKKRQDQTDEQSKANVEIKKQDKIIKYPNQDHSNIAKLIKNKQLVDTLAKESVKNSSNKHNQDETSRVEISGHSWIERQNAGNYTIQIAGSNNLHKLLELAETSPIANDLAFYKTTRKGKAWYSLIYGSFDSFSDASAKTELLPEEFKTWSPWIRKMGEVQKNIASTDK